MPGITDDVVAISSSDEKSSIDRADLKPSWSTTSFSILDSRRRSILSISGSVMRNICPLGESNSETFSSYSSLGITSSFWVLEATTVAALAKSPGSSFFNPRIKASFFRSSCCNSVMYFSRITLGVVLYLMHRCAPVPAA
ncbi:hypothetical protein ES708_16070 [subsurface metagenome]